jgi:L-lactate dehydrogenase complex protein LldE
VTEVGLFIPCYVDQFYPQVGLATVTLLERLGCRVHYPEAQTCCGQPMANAGSADAAAPLAERFLQIFKQFPYIVCPSGSCVSMVRNHYRDLLPGRFELDAVGTRTFELCEFLVDVLHVEAIPGRFPYRVGLHQSCHGLRELRLGSGYERLVPSFNKVRKLLASLEGITLVELSRPDECCGFGGVFSVDEEAVSCAMGKDRIADHLQAGAEVITGVDVSCLMHLEGLLRREKKASRVQHVAEILAGVAT